ncbi:nitrate reductase molybdenum cofactor assembly chaperone [Pseudomonas aeruginosa]
MNDHSQLFRLLALLLDYPRAELREESLGLHALIRTCELPEALRDGLAALLNELCQGDLLDVQARYDGLFERGRSVSLLLFEHVHGESRDRGQAMVDLLDRYTGAWEETPVSFTDPAGGCPSSSGRRPTASTEQPLQWVAQPVPQMQYRAAREGV